MATLVKTVDYERVVFDSVDPATAKEDGVIFRKYSGVLYQRRNDSPFYPARLWKIFPNQWRQWDTEFKQVFETIPEGKKLYLPTGFYQNKETITINRHVGIQGDGKNTIICNAANKIGIHIRPGAGDAEYRNFRVRAFSNDFTDGRNPDGSFNNDQDDHKQHGIYIESVVTLWQVWSSHQTGHGFYWHGVIGDGTDASNCKVYNCQSLENGGSGYYMKGPDANSIKFYACSASDNGGYGWCDASFLGNHSHGIMCHYNRLSDFNNKDANARTTNFAVYSEGGSPESTYGSVHTMELGGINAPGSVGGGSRQSGEIMTGRQRWGSYVFERDTIMLDQLILNRQTYYKSGFSFDYTGDLFGFAGKDEETQRGDAKRKLGADRAYGKLVEIAGVLYGGFHDNFEHNLKQPPYNAIDYLPNDFIANHDYKKSTYQGWRCYQAGKGLAAKFEIVGQGEGLYSEMPKKSDGYKGLLPMHSGYKYYATDKKQFYTWNGKEYV